MKSLTASTRFSSTRVTNLEKYDKVHSSDRPRAPVRPGMKISALDQNLQPAFLMGQISDSPRFCPYCNLERRPLAAWNRETRLRHQSQHRCSPKAMQNNPTSCLRKRRNRRSESMRLPVKMRKKRQRRESISIGWTIGSKCFQENNIDSPGVTDSSCPSQYHCQDLPD